MRIMRPPLRFATTPPLEWTVAYNQANHEPQNKAGHMDDQTLFILLTNFISLLAGLLIGNWLAIGRDRRNEFNAIVDPIRAMLLKERADPTPYTPGINDIDADRLHSVLPIWHRRAFSQAWLSYCQNKKEGIAPDNFLLYRNPGEVVLQIDALLRYAIRK